jgi:hypothetical protein
MTVLLKEADVCAHAIGDIQIVIPFAIRSRVMENKI